MTVRKAESFEDLKRLFFSETTIVSENRERKARKLDKSKGVWGTACYNSLKAKRKQEDHMKLGQREIMKHEKLLTELGISTKNPGKGLHIQNQETSW